MPLVISAHSWTLGLFSFGLQFEFVSGILVLGTSEGAPIPQGLRALRPRLAEVAPVEAALVADLREQLLELFDCKICVSECVWIRWPVGYFIRHTGKDIPNFLAQFHCKLLCGTQLALVRFSFVERPVVSRLGNRQSQRHLAPGITCIGFLKVIFPSIQNYIEPVKD
jgi:hypothetical protein